MTNVETIKQKCGRVFFVTNNYTIDVTEMLGENLANHIYSLENATPGAGVGLFKKFFLDTVRFTIYDIGSNKGKEAD